ncbi:MAG: hypothetical protein B7Z75_09835 [Acidocella sp. 20-57-95]|nr:MAG: hypothetical protein B7Z75_09835 [Acidocella sp. 20-57-95]HQT65016.1 hypothetical protein [Acidocella sp.]HQU05214.1 hypothetical protein [Acidocella sp.]
MAILSLDGLVRQKLRAWPNQPPGLEGCWDRAWLKARPAVNDEIENPYLKMPGTKRMKTVPDGLWMNFGGSERDPFVDIFVIEVCGTFPNLLDKRSRFSPSMHSLLAVCPLNWLLGDFATTDATPRWKRTKLLKAAPSAGITVPVRDIRVVYGLRPRDYESFAANQVPHAHEFFMPVSVLLGQEGWLQPEMRAFIARTSPQANFWAFNVAAE